MNRRTVLHATGGGLLAGFTGCTSLLPTSDSNFDTTLTDGFGRTVAVPDTVDRVVGVGPGALRQLAYLGVTDRVVGVETASGDWLSRVPYRIANPTLADRPTIGTAGPDAGGNPEQILQTSPDVIVYYGSRSRAETLQHQTSTPVVGIQLSDFVGTTGRETVYATWRLLGNLFNRSTRAEKLISFVKETIAELQDRTTAVSSTTDAFAGGISYRGANGLATTRHPFPPFQYVNVANVASEIAVEPSVPVDKAQLLKWDPSLLFVSADNLARIRTEVADSVYTELTAIATECTYSLLPHASYHENYGSILANAYFIGKTVYPEQFADCVLADAIDEIYTTMLGTALYEELLDQYPAHNQLSLL